MKFFNNKRTTVFIKGHLVTLSFCLTCFRLRPPRCSHCATCDNCVEQFDHHCSWLGNCIGRRNYSHFLWFLILSNTTLLFELGTSVFIFIWKTAIIGDEDERKGEFVTLIIFSALASLLICGFLFTFLFRMLFEHFNLAASNTLYYEKLKEKFKTFFGNPFCVYLLKKKREAR